MNDKDNKENEKRVEVSLMDQLRSWRDLREAAEQWINQTVGISQERAGSTGGSPRNIERIFCRELIDELLAVKPPVKAVQLHGTFEEESPEYKLWMEGAGFNHVQLPNFWNSEAPAGQYFVSVDPYQQDIDEWGQIIGRKHPDGTVEILKARRSGANAAAQYRYYPQEPEPSPRSLTSISGLRQLLPPPRPSKPQPPEDAQDQEKETETL